MRPRKRLRACALLAICTAPLSLAGSAQQLPLLAPALDKTPPHATKVTLVDLLSADPDHSLLIRLLQRSRLITTLNRLNGSTFFAPTNDAIQLAAAVAPQGIWAAGLAEEDELRHRPVDNRQTQLRATLLYHMLNYTLPYNTSIGPSDVEMHETLLFPSPDQGEGSPGEPPSQDMDSLLAGEGQKLRLARREANARIATVVGVDAAGRGGVQVVKTDRNATNGNLISIAGVLDPPKSIGELVHEHPALRQLARLLPPAMLQDLTSRPHVTLFAPNDASWSALTPLEWRYLNSGFAEGDLGEILDDHTKSRSEKTGSIGYASRLLKESKRGELVTDGGSSLQVAQNDLGRLLVNESSLVEADVLASNGVIHVIDGLLLPSDSLGLTVEKTLIALNATLYVAAMRSANLSHHLQRSLDDGPQQTILAFQDIAVELEWVTLPEPGTIALAETLQYHIIEGAWQPEQLVDGQLLSTLLQPEALRHNAQRVPVARPPGSERNSSDGIVFGNANVVSGPYNVGQSVVYMIGQVIEPPAHALEVAMTDLRLSTFAASAYAAEIERRTKQSPATTIFAPTNDAFRTLGLTLNYLLLPSAKAELKQTLLYHIVDDLVYLDANVTDSRAFRTLEGSDLYLEQFNKTTAVHGPTVTGFPANGDLRNASVLPTSEVLLTRTGVMHVIDQVELPPTVSIDVVKLMRGAKGTTMLELLRLADMSWVLEGLPQPEDPQGDEQMVETQGKRKRRQRKLFNRDSYTILCPSDKAFSKLNLTYYRSDIPALRELLELHVIRSEPPKRSAINDPSRFPSDGQPLALADESTFSTLLSERSKYGDVAFRIFGSHHFVVGVKGARGASGIDDWASVTAYGRATPRFAFDDEPADRIGDMAAVTVGAPRMVFGGGVLAIDAVLTPYRPGWYVRWGWIVAVVLLSLFAASMVGILILRVWRHSKAIKYERLEGEED